MANSKSTEMESGLSGPDCSYECKCPPIDILSCLEANLTLKENTK